MLSTLYKLIAAIKSKFYVILGIGWAISFVIAIRPFVLAATFLAIFDTFTGVWAAKKRGEKITLSRGLYRTVEKILVYFLSISAAAILETVFFNAESKIEFLPNLFLIYLVSASICVTEFLSLRENVQSITGVDILGGFKKNISKILDAFPRKEDLN